MTHIGSISDEKFAEIVAASDSWVDIVRALGLSDKAAGNWRTVQRRTRRLGLSVEHFTRARMKYSSGRWQKTPLDQILIENSNYSNLALKNRLVKEGLLEPECSRCHIKEWLGERLVLELEHINGISSDNRLENLTILCPNCHSQTRTWRGRNIPKSKNKTCPKCQGPKYYKSKTCKACTKGAPTGRTKIQWPDREALRADVSKHGYEATGRKLGLTGAAVKKHLRRKEV